MLISQRFHLPRALGICEALGMEAIGVSADLRPYGSLTVRFWQLREIPATLAALWDAYITPMIDTCVRHIQPQKGDSHES
ncbi:MAG: hypothetical protein A2Z14_03790 [Chloroflexi bacterium RBG_16_48_8]|nr:MAG: hypothetical protein A2Z14_03790 [Chloroflexi bacterium RBG_16_48_8]